MSVSIMPTLTPVCLLCNIDSGLPASAFESSSCVSWHSQLCVLYSVCSVSLFCIFYYGLCISSSACPIVLTSLPTDCVSILFASRYTHYILLHWPGSTDPPLLQTTPLHTLGLESPTPLHIRINFLVQVGKTTNTKINRINHLMLRGCLQASSSRLLNTLYFIDTLE